MLLYGYEICFFPSKGFNAESVAAYVGCLTCSKKKTHCLQTSCSPLVINMLNYNDIVHVVHSSTISQKKLPEPGRLVWNTIFSQIYRHMLWFNRILLEMTTLAWHGHHKLLLPHTGKQCNSLSQHSLSCCTDKLASMWGHQREQAHFCGSGSLPVCICGWAQFHFWVCDCVGSITYVYFCVYVSVQEYFCDYVYTCFLYRQNCTICYVYAASPEIGHLRKGWKSQLCFSALWCQCCHHTTLSEWFLGDPGKGQKV